MKLSSILKELAVFCYFVIFLKGSVVSLPMFVYLLFTVADFGTIQQLFSAIAFVGLIIHFLHLWFRSRTKKFIADSFVFACLLAPILEKLFTIPLERFNYTLFLVPGLAFVLFYTAGLALMVKGWMENQPLAVNSPINDEQGKQ